MTFEQTVVLSAFAGATILLGLPVGRLRNLSTRTQAMLTAAAAGVILFLIWDILSQAIEPIESTLEGASTSAGPPADFWLDAAAFAGSLAVGLLALVWVSRRTRTVVGGAPLTPDRLALGTALGLGLHNLSEGLAIGNSAATGATNLALVLVIGFALHNATEGFGIAAPLASGPRPSWAFLGLLGAIGGGPTFVGGVIGWSLTAPLLSIVFLGLAAGALIFVFNEMMSVSRRFAQPMSGNAALVAGLLVALGTDLLLLAAGA